ncbi:hypothetical protein DPMN_023797 [Dreissena polymorpha]|uniref:Uncharacterized protein n=1 Tax=Dreissena polymorpha TaxID=45954 RepID=A0A9D4LNC8_DREPO|nr:hypothetical protein DPMN_023797 [Dreissena polymorpha]
MQEFEILSIKVINLCHVIGIAFFCDNTYVTKLCRAIGYNEHAYPSPPPPYYDPRLPPHNATNGYVKKAPANTPYPSAFVDSPHVKCLIFNIPRTTIGNYAPRARVWGNRFRNQSGKRAGSVEAVGDRKYSTDRRSENVPNEFVVQQSFDGIPIIRPVIYIDDDDDDSRQRARSKSCVGRQKKRNNDTQSPKIRELHPDTTEVKATAAENTEVVIELRPRSRSRNPPQSRDVASALQSRAMSEADDFNQLRRSIKDEEPSRNSPVAVAGPSCAGDEGYEVPIRRSAKGQSSNAASSNHTNRPKTPPFDAPETARSGLASQGNVLNRSLAVEPTTGQPGSFQARQRLIEAHLQKNQSGPAPSKPTPSTSVAHRPETTPLRQSLLFR